MAAAPTATAPTAAGPVTLEENWSRCAVAVKLHGCGAVIDILITLGLPDDENILFVWMKEFKRVDGKKLKKIINDSQWDILCHDCSKCVGGCARKGKYFIIIYRKSSQY